MISNQLSELKVPGLPLGAFPRLVAVDGPLSGRSFYLDEAVVSIGRLDSNGIHLDDPFVSRQHCLIKTTGDQYLIEDLASANGTYVNGERIDTVALNEGFLIQIGSSRFRFRLRSPERPVTQGPDLAA